MPNTTSATWPALSAGARARASDVEAKFDFSEYHLWPHGGGSLASNTYDLGNTTTTYWRTLYANSINATSTANGIAIGTTTANTSALLELAGTKAFLLPRLSTAQRDALTPADGMLIYNSSTTQYQFYRNAAWANVGGNVFRSEATISTATYSVTTQTVLNISTGGGRLNGIMLTGQNASVIPNMTVVLDGVTVFTLAGATTGVYDYSVNPDATYAAFVGTSTVETLRTRILPYLGWDFATSAAVHISGVVASAHTITARIVVSKIV